MPNPNEKVDRLHGKLIKTWHPYKKKYSNQHKKTSDCPVCMETLSDRTLLPVELVGNLRMTWVHYSCKEDLKCGNEYAVLEEEKRLDGIQEAKDISTSTPQGIFAGSESFDDLIRDIAIEAAVEAAVRAVKEMGPTRIELQYPNGKTRQIEEVTHSIFQKVLKYAARRQPIFLSGPTGTGKSHLVQQIAKSLTRIDSDEPLPFYETPCSAGITEGHLLGRLLPTGEGGKFEYTHAILSRAYEEGGICCLEEIDSSDPNTLLCVNNALETQQMTLPNRIKDWYAKRHPDFVLIIVGNTFGTGADRSYVGRLQLDDAFLDRFKMRTIEVGYDKELEAHLCPDEVLLEMLHTWRDRIETNNLRRWISTRTIIRCYEDYQAGDSIDEITEMFFVGWPEDEKNLVLTNNNEGDEDVI